MLRYVVHTPYVAVQLQPQSLAALKCISTERAHGTTVHMHFAVRLIVSQQYMCIRQYSPVKWCVLEQYMCIRYNSVKFGVSQQHMCIGQYHSVTWTVLKQYMCIGQYVSVKCGVTAVHVSNAVVHSHPPVQASAQSRDGGGATAPLSRWARAVSRGATSCG